MSQFYALASTKEKPNLIVPLQSTTRIKAENEAKSFCKENQLEYQETRNIKTAEKKGSTLTKNAEQRKRQRGLESKRRSKNKK